MRPIDADALLDAYDAAHKGPPGAARKLIEEAPTIDDWIGADKRPPKQGRYLVWGLTQIVPDHNDEPNGYWQTKIAQWFEGIGWDCKVKRWRPLPEPPKED